MTNLSKNGERQTALDLGDSPRKGADQFDEVTYRAELIAAGIPPADAAAIAELVLLGMHLGTAVYFEAALVIAMLGFVGTVVLSKYVMRRDIVE